MDTRLREVLNEIGETRWAASLIDADWNLVWVSDELKVLLGESDEEKLGYGCHILECWLRETWLKMITQESQVDAFLQGMPYVIGGTPGGIARVKEILANHADVDLSGLSLEGLEPKEAPPIWVHNIEYVQEGFGPSVVRCLAMRLYASEGEHLGTLHLYGSALPARILAMVARGDERMFERMSRLVQPGRRKAAVLFADLQDSGVLSRRLPSAAYFRLVSAITAAMDKVVIEHEGIVGKHVGDGATAFFLAEDAGSSSAAAAAAIRAARDICRAVAVAAKDVGTEVNLVEAADLKVNVGVHWGGTLYMGQLVTGGRLEITALGDSVNECARIQESARDGEILVSKSIAEHLTQEDAASLGIDPDAVVYRPIADLPMASEKAVRDAGTIAVTVL